MAILTVTQVNRYVAFQLKADARMQGILVRGEISGFVRHQRSGHCYFTLKDAESSVKAVLFRTQAQRLRFPLRDGMQVIAAATAALYEKEGTFQLYITDIQPEGAGQQQTALEQLKERLRAAGVFDTAIKKPLPPFPKQIGVVTSASGAAIHDITQVLRRRYPLAEVTLFPAQVQGEAAPAEIVSAIAKAQQAGCDVLIVGRGGGSAEDLWAFQTEPVVMAVYHCTIPVISAVGHETDWTLTDAAADVRAATPSVAAELAAPAKEAVQEQLRQLQQRMHNAVSRLLTQKQNQLLAQTERLRQASPMTILEKGYAMVSKDGEWIQTAAQVQPEELLTIRWRDGSVQVKVVKAEETL